ncbi:MAG: hypothetical protein HQ538_03030, partial [Parcubacteria group bacterium]|nr:hypothetical protein [Parcubacteria group bacterium]
LKLKTYVKKKPIKKHIEIKPKLKVKYKPIKKKVIVKAKKEKIEERILTNKNQEVVAPWITQIKLDLELLKINTKLLSLSPNPEDISKLRESITELRNSISQRITERDGG